MRHPFIHDLSDKTTDDLSKTIADLQKKLTFAYRSQNHTMINQLRMVVETYQEEFQNRLNDMYKKQNLEDKINITKDNK
jgi:hypothetical protein